MGVSKPREPLALRGTGTERGGRIRVLLVTPDLLVGIFTLPSDDEMWAADNSIGDLPHVVWPMTSVEIRRTKHGRQCADATSVMLYDADTEYRRRPLTRLGDRSLFIAVAPAVLESLRSPVVHDGQRFRTGRLTCAPAAWLRVQLVAAAAEADPAALEQVALDVVAESLSVGEPAGQERAARVRDRVEAAREALGHRLDEPLALADVARQVGVSPFHLARQFRAATGSSMYGYRQQLRARTALVHALEEPTKDLSRLAAEHGYASHSHLTATCRRTLGVTPSAARRDRQRLVGL